MSAAISAVIVGFLSLLGTLAGSWGGMRLMSYRIEQLELKVESVTQTAQRLPIIEEQIKTICHRLEELEHAKD